MADLDKVFGKGELNITPNTCTNCGLRHDPLKDGSSMGQTENLAALKPTSSSELIEGHRSRPSVGSPVYHLTPHTARYRGMQESLRIERHSKVGTATSSRYYL